MKLYRLTAAGRRQLSVELSKWQQVRRAIGLVLGRATGGSIDPATALRQE